MDAPTSAWQAAGVSVTGLSHLRSGSPCQDAHQLTLRADGLVVAAVADGAGSAPRAERGAACAVQTALAFLTDHLAAGLPQHEENWRALLHEALGATRQAVVAEAAACESPPSDLATTLLIAVATRDLVAACQVGDGAVVARLTDGNFQTVTHPSIQEYLNETTFLTSADALDQAQHAILQKRATGLALFSDGLQMLALRMPQATPHPPFFAPLLRLVAEIRDRSLAEDQLRRFLQSPRVTQRADDDLTLVLAVRTGA
jgi:serine/threonine protein phosphatase PrpC